MIRVLVVDDFVIARAALQVELQKDASITVIGAARDAYEARDMILQLRPDVITLDIEMPRLDGLSFLQELMKHHPLPVVVVSSLAPENSATALRALELGAIDVLSKPGVSLAPNPPGKLARAVRGAATARMDRFRAGPLKPPPALARTWTAPTRDPVIAIGASTGGVAAIEAVLVNLPEDAPGTVIVQHMPQRFTGAFADRLDSACPMRVREASDGDQVTPGLALVAPGDVHMVLVASGGGFAVRLKQGPTVHYQRPSVEVLFYSVAHVAAARSIGVLLTGMGADGARGLLAMREAGAHTISESQETCVVYGMPREAEKLGASAEVLPLPRIGLRVTDLAQRARRAP